MANVLRMLLGGALGAGEGYFRGQDMKRQMEEDAERRALNTRRVDLEEERWRASERERAAREAAAKRENDAKVSQDFRDHFRKVSMGARHGGMLSRLMGNPEDMEARDTLLRENPQMLSQWRTDMKDREPPADRRVTHPVTGEPFASPQEYLQWKASESAAGRAPRETPGESGPSKSEQDEAMQGLAILNSANQMDPETKRRFLQAFQQATAAYPGSAGRAAYRAWQGGRLLRVMTLDRSL